MSVRTPSRPLGVLFAPVGEPVWNITADLEPLDPALGFDQPSGPKPAS